MKLIKKSKLQYQLGCHPGETGILTAAGRHFFALYNNPVFVEGSYGELLLEKDILKTPLGFDKECRALIPEKPGLGILLDKKTIKHYTQKEIKING